MLGYVMIGMAFGLVMLTSALLSGWGIGFALLIGWMSASLGVVATVGLAATRIPVRATAAVAVEDEAIGA